MRISSFVLMTLLACGASAASAQSAPAEDASAPPAAASAHRHASIWTVDANQDGMLSRDELQSRPGLLRHFDEIDGNHDGQIDRAEWRAWHQQMKARREQRMQSEPAENSSGG